MTGAVLPERLIDCPAGVRASWYGQACYQTAHLIARAERRLLAEDLGVVPVPSGVEPAPAEELRRKAFERAKADHGFYD